MNQQKSTTPKLKKVKTKQSIQLQNLTLEQLNNIAGGPPPVDCPACGEKN